MFCGNCGKQLPDSAAFCPVCGAKQSPAQAPEPPQAASATEFFSAPASAPEPPAPPVEDNSPPAPDLQADPEIDPDESATAFFSAPPVGSPVPEAPEPVAPVSGPSSDSAAPGQAADGFFQSPPAGSSATEFFGAPLSGGPGYPPPASPAGTPPASGPILSSSLRRTTQSAALRSSSASGGAIIGKGKSRIGLFVGLGVAVVVLIVLVVGLIRFIGGAFGTKQPVFWVSDYSLMYASKPGGKAVEIFDHLSDSSVAIAMSENNKYAYVLARPNSETVLYRVELGKLKADSNQNENYITKVDSNVNINYWNNRTTSYAGGVSVISDSSFHISDDGKKLYYLSDGNRLRYFNGAENETLEKNVNSFQVSKNGKLLLIDKGSELFLRGVNPNDTPESIIDGYVSILKTSDDFSEIFYTSRSNDVGLNLNVYTKKGTEKLASKVETVVAVESRTQFAYTRAQDDERPLSDYVEDDMAAQDARISQPSSRSGTAYDRYQEKRQRDRLREDLNRSTYRSNTYTLYVHHGNDEKEICDQLTSSFVTAEHGVYLYNRREQSSDTRLRISEISSTSDIYNALDGATQSAIADDSGEKKIFDSSLSNCITTKNGDLYAIEREDEALVCFTKNGKYADRKQISQDVEALYYLSGADQVYFMTDTDDLYTVKKGAKDKVASDVESDLFLLYSDGALVLLDDVGSNGMDLNYLTSSGKKQSLGEDVNGCYRLKGDRFLVLADYHYNSGTLYLCGGKEREKIANDVSGYCAFGGEEPALASSF